MRKALLLAVVCAVVGCKGSGGTTEVSGKDDAALRNNFSRALTPEEAAQMGKSSMQQKSGPAGMPQKGPR